MNFLVQQAPTRRYASCRSRSPCLSSSSRATLPHASAAGHRIRRGGEEVASVRSFTLLDLADQAPFVPDAVREQRPPRILAWLRQFGEVKAYPICFYFTAGTSGAFHPLPSDGSWHPPRRPRRRASPSRLAAARNRLSRSAFPI